MQVTIDFDNSGLDELSLKKLSIDDFKKNPVIGMEGSTDPRFVIGTANKVKKNLQENNLELEVEFIDEKIPIVKKMMGFKLTEGPSYRFSPVVVKRHNECKLQSIQLYSTKYEQWSF